MSGQSVSEDPLPDERSVVSAGIRPGGGWMSGQGAPGQLVGHAIDLLIDVGQQLTYSRRPARIDGEFLQLLPEAVTFEDQLQVGQRGVVEIVSCHRLDGRVGAPRRCRRCWFRRAIHIGSASACSGPDLNGSTGGCRACHPVCARTSCLPDWTGSRPGPRRPDSTASAAHACIHRTRSDQSASWRMHPAAA